MQRHVVEFRSTFRVVTPMKRSLPTVASDSPRVRFLLPTRDAHELYCDQRRFERMNPERAKPSA